MLVPKAARRGSASLYDAIFGETSKICSGDCSKLALKRRVREQINVAATNSKGCDIGYAPSASSCEGAHSLDTCTVTALDAITAFAVPDPNSSSQSLSVFSGLGVLRITSSDKPLSLLRISYG